MKYLITLIVIITQIFAGANLIVKMNNESVTSYPIIEITQLDFNQDLDTMYIHTVNTDNYYRISEIESIEFDDELSIDDFKILILFRAF